jgi:hypothetical protein
MLQHLSKIESESWLVGCGAEPIWFQQLTWKRAKVPVQHVFWPAIGI